MRRKWFDTRARGFRFVIVTLSILTCGIGVSLGQGSPDQATGIVSVTASSVVETRVEIRASDKQLVIPHCGTTETGEYVLCTGQAHLELKDGKLWSNARPKSGGAILGGMPRERWESCVILPGHQAYFMFTFSKAFLSVQQNQQLRVAVNAWANEESLKSGGAVATLWSPTFMCP
jgi:hypothetical protein